VVIRCSRRFSVVFAEISRRPRYFDIADNNARCKCYFKENAIRIVKDSARSRAIFVGPIWHEREKFILRARFSSLPRVKSRPTRTPRPKLGFLVSPLLLFLSLSIIRSCSLSLSKRKSSRGASEPFIIFLVTSHPGKTSWQRNYVCDDYTPRHRPFLPRAATISRPQCPLPFYHSLEIFWF